MTTPTDDRRKVGSLGQSAPHATILARSMRGDVNLGKLPVDGPRAPLEGGLLRDTLCACVQFEGLEKNAADGATASKIAGNA